MRTLTTLLFALPLFLPACKKASDDTSPTVSSHQSAIYLVRHAEKQKGENPGLTASGHQRAQALKTRLVDQNITHIHSSNYRRTLETAAPLADALGLEVKLYDPRDLLGISETVTTTPGKHLIVGHSNTTPQLGAILSAQVMKEMPETEYDRFIEIKLKPDGTIQSFDVTTYGARSEKEQ